MQIELRDVSKFFIRNRVLSEVSYIFLSGKRYAVLGANGAGKSTLLGIVSGLSLPTFGEVIYSNNNEIVAAEEFYKYFTISAPYLSFVNDFSILEIIEFHFKLKDSYFSTNPAEVAQRCMFSSDEHNRLYKHLSSGMKQRLKIGLAILTKGNVLLLDEPFSNLDIHGKDWCRKLLHEFLNDRTLLIASNDPEEYEICDNFINL